MTKPCRSCGHTHLTTVVYLGVQPPSNAYLHPGEQRLERRYPLCAVRCESCDLVQLDYDVPAAELFTAHYEYASSQSAEWVAHCKAYCEMAADRFHLTGDSVVVEIASNDGHLLKNFVDAGIPCIGIEPAANLAVAAMQIGVVTRVAFFGEKVAESLPKADLVIGNNVLAHVPDLNDFIAGVKKLLKPLGRATFEFPCLAHMLKKGAFDTIYHEHYSYFSLRAVSAAFARHDLTIYDVEELPTHGGSLRIFVGHSGANAFDHWVKWITLAYKAVPSDSAFAQGTARVRVDMWNLLARIKCGGKKVCGYGAAAKGNTFLNYCGITAADIRMIADTTPAKQGLLTPGSHIPIVDPETMFASKPDYVLLLPWNWEHEIMPKLERIKTWGGKVVIAIPQVRIL